MTFSELACFPVMSPGAFFLTNWTVTLQPVLSAQKCTENGLRNAAKSWEITDCYQ